VLRTATSPRTRGEEKEISFSRRILISHLEVRPRT
jgi:hypothetical protein